MLKPNKDYMTVMREGKRLLDLRDFEYKNSNKYAINGGLNWFVALFVGILAWSVIIWAIMALVGANTIRASNDISISTNTPKNAVYIDISIIAMIESGGNPLAYNKKSGAIGLCQITKPVLIEFNRHFKQHYTTKDLYNGRINVLVADWYMNHRIPQMLKHYKIEDTVRNRLWAYNADIGRVLDGNMPNETKNYIVKYEGML